MRTAGRSLSALVVAWAAGACSTTPSLPDAAVLVPIEYGEDARRFSGTALVARYVESSSPEFDWDDGFVSPVNEDTSRGALDIRFPETGGWATVWLDRTDGVTVPEFTDREVSFLIGRGMDLTGRSDNFGYPGLGGLATWCTGNDGSYLRPDLTPGPYVIYLNGYPDDTAGAVVVRFEIRAGKVTVLRMRK